MSQEIEIRIDDGVVAVDEIPEGTKLTVRDFDIHDDDPAALFVDVVSGKWFRKLVFTSEGLELIMPQPSQSAAAQLLHENG